MAHPHDLCDAVVIVASDLRFHSDLSIGMNGFVAVASSTPPCTAPPVLSRHGDAFAFVFPADASTPPPCGWTVSVPVTADNVGQFVTLGFSSFSVPCPGALLVTDVAGALLFEMCGDGGRATPEADALVLRGPVGSTLVVHVSFRSTVTSTYSFAGTLRIGAAADSPLVCGTVTAAPTAVTESVRTQVVVSTSAMSAARVLLSDVDGDADLDTVYVTNSTVEWMENVGGASGFAAAPFVIAPAVYSAYGGAVVSDVSGDGRPDVVVGASKCDKVGRLSLFVNSGGRGAFVFSTSEIVISDAVFGINAVSAFDIDLVSACLCHVQLRCCCECYPAGACVAGRRQRHRIRRRHDRGVAAKHRDGAASRRHAVVRPDGSGAVHRAVRHRPQRPRCLQPDVQRCDVCGNGRRDVNGPAPIQRHRCRCAAASKADVDDDVVLQRCRGRREPGLGTRPVVCRRHLACGICCSDGVVAVVCSQLVDVVYSTRLGASWINNVSFAITKPAELLPFSFCSSSFVCVVELGDVELDGDMDILYTAFDYGVGWLENMLVVNPPPATAPSVNITFRQRPVSEAMKIPTSVALGDVTGAFANWLGRLELPRC